MSFTGLLNTVCTIFQRSQAEDATTGQHKDTYGVKYFGIPCRLDQADGGSFMAPQRIKEKATHILFIPMSFDVQETDLIQVGSVQYTVLLVSNAGGQNHHKEVILEYVR